MNTDGSQGKLLQFNRVFDTENASRSNSVSWEMRMATILHTRSRKNDSAFFAASAHGLENTYTNEALDSRRSQEDDLLPVTLPLSR